MMDLFLIILTGICAFLVLISMLALLRANDIFTMTHITMIFNCFVVPICLVTIEIKSFFNLSVTLKIITISLLNILIANIICYLVPRRAVLNKIQPDAEIINPK